jgi:tRNA(adenine34) deaminase
MMTAEDAKSNESRDLHWMGEAIKLAEAAALAGEVPVGALIVDEATDKLVAIGHNSPISDQDPTGHAEIAALRAAASALGNYRLVPGLTLYVTLEPCTMCAGAISHARISRLVYGAADPKGGAIDSGVRFFQQLTCHWRPTVTSGVLAQQSSSLLRDFFKKRRATSSQ